MTYWINITQGQYQDLSHLVQFLWSCMLNFHSRVKGKRRLDTYIDKRKGNISWNKKDRIWVHACKRDSAISTWTENSSFPLIPFFSYLFFSLSPFSIPYSLDFFITGSCIVSWVASRSSNQPSLLSSNLPHLA